MARSTRDERGVVSRFADRYAHRGNDADLQLELAVIGANVGCNGYTTLRQVDAIGRSLRLRAGMRLLDIGAGRGYPGVYLARTTGCETVSCDLTLPALRQGLRRAHREKTLRRCAFLAASAVHLPFLPGTFDAIVHTDVLC